MPKIESKSVYRNNKILHTVLLEPFGPGESYRVTDEATGEWLLTTPSERMARFWADAYLYGWGKGYDHDHSAE